MHAEANAIAWAARHGVALLGSDMFTTWSPCVKCSQLIINAGIQRVCYAQDYRVHEGRNLLQIAGIALDHLPVIA